MPKNFIIDLDPNLGNIGGNWGTNYPSFISPMTPQEGGIALNQRGLSGIIQTTDGTYARWFVGDFILSGGNDEDGTYASMGDLPVGFTVESAIVKCSVSIIPGYSVQITALGPGVGGSFSGSGNANLEYIYFDVPDVFYLNSEQIGITCTASGGILSVYNLRIEGTYSLGPGQGWQQNPITNEVKYGPITPDWNVIPTPIYHNPTTGEFLVYPPEIPGIPWIPWIPLEPITFVGIPLITPSTIYPILIGQSSLVPWYDIPIPPPIEFTPIFPFTPSPDDEGDPIIIVTTPTQTDNGFTINVGGSALFVFIENPSGIYTLIPGQTHDTLYDRTGLTQLDVKIPNPFIETGFMGQ